MLLAKLGDWGKVKLRPGQHLIEGQSELGEVLLLDDGLEGLGQPLHLSISRYCLVHRHQPVIIVRDSTGIVQLQSQHTQIGGILSAGNNQGIIDLNRLLQGGVGVAGDDHVDAVHRLSQLIVLPFSTIGAGVGETHNHRGTFQLGQFLLQGRHLSPGSIGHRLKFHARHGSAGIRVLPHQAKNAVVDPTSGEDDVILHAVVLHRLDQFLAPLPVQHRTVGLYDGGHPAAAGGCRLQHLGQTRGPVVKLMVAQGGHIIPHSPQCLQLRRLGGIDGLKQRSHGEVAAIHRDGIGILHPFQRKKGRQAGIATIFPAIFRGRRIKMIMGIVGEQNHGVVAVLRRSPGRADEDQQNKG